MYRPYSNSQADSRPFRDVESQLRDLTQDFAMAFNTGNYDQAAAFFAADGELMAPQRVSACGPKPVERLLRQLGEAGYSDLRLATERGGTSRGLGLGCGGYVVIAGR